MNKIIAILAVIVVGMVAFHIYDWMTFVKAGPRFTAYNGQELCERVAQLESQPAPCNYAEKK